MSGDADGLVVRLDERLADTIDELLVETLGRAWRRGRERGEVALLVLGAAAVRMGWAARVGNRSGDRLTVIVRVARLACRRHGVVLDDAGV